MKTPTELREVASIYDEKNDMHLLLMGVANDLERLTAELGAEKTAKAHAVQQAQIWKMEAVTQKAIVKDRDAKLEQYKADAEMLRYAVTIGPNQSMNWLDVYDDWDGEGLFIDALLAAMKGQPCQPEQNLMSFIRRLTSSSK
jgi:hypothetical protein